MSCMKGKDDKNNEKVIKQCQPDRSVIRVVLLECTCAENESERLAANKNHQSCSAAKTIDSFNIPTSFLLRTSESHTILLRIGEEGERRPADQRTNELFYASFTVLN